MTRLLLIRHGLTDAVGHHLAGIAPGTHLNDVCSKIDVAEKEKFQILTGIGNL